MKTSENTKLRPQELTRAELEIMQLFWVKGPSMVNDLLEAMPEPKPAYNTVSTVVRILEKKGFVGHKAYGKTYEYYPIVSKEVYASRYMDTVLDNFFRWVVEPSGFILFRTQIHHGRGNR